MLKRLRKTAYYTQLEPLKEKFPEQNLEDLAKYGKCNIIIWHQARKSKNPEIISKSSTNFTDDLNIVTKTRYHPYNHAKYQVNLDELKANIYNSQSTKIQKMKIWEAIERNFEISKNELLFRWGDTISIKREFEFRELFGRGFSVYFNHDENYYTAEKIYGSMHAGFSFIVGNGDLEEFSIDMDVTVILDDKYLQHFFCEKTPHCPYKVIILLIISDFNVYKM